MTLADLERRLDAIARRISRPRNAAVMTTPELRARLCDRIASNSTVILYPAQSLAPTDEQIGNLLNTFHNATTAP